jgi:hypothetical protein
LQQFLQNTYLIFECLDSGVQVLGKNRTIFPDQQNLGKGGLKNKKRKWHKKIFFTNTLPFWRHVLLLNIPVGSEFQPSLAPVERCIPTKKSDCSKKVDFDLLDTFLPTPHR